MILTIAEICPLCGMQLHFSRREEAFLKDWFARRLGDSNSQQTSYERALQHHLFLNSQVNSGDFNERLKKSKRDVCNKFCLLVISRSQLNSRDMMHLVRVHVRMCNRGAARG